MVFCQRPSGVFPEVLLVEEAMVLPNVANGEKQIDGKAPFVDSCSGLHQEVWPASFGANVVVTTTVKQLQRDMRSQLYLEQCCAPNVTLLVGVGQVACCEAGETTWRKWHRGGLNKCLLYVVILCNDARQKKLMELFIFEARGEE